MADSRELRFPTSDDGAPDSELRQRLAASYAALPAASPAQVAACTTAVLAAAARSRRPFLRPWWWGAAAAAVLVVSVSRPWRPDAAQRHADSAVSAASAAGAPVGSTTEEPSGAVHFELALPTTATQVVIVGDFNGWDEKATPMKRDGAEWSARVALPPGRHVYAFVVDGSRWLVDPMAPQVPDAGYGPANAVIVDAK
jgi:hypothetical protein